MPWWCVRKANLKGTLPQRNVRSEVSGVHLQEKTYLQKSEASPAALEWLLTPDLEDAEAAALAEPSSLFTDHLNEPQEVLRQLKEAAANTANILGAGSIRQDVVWISNPSGSKEALAQHMLGQLEEESTPTISVCAAFVSKELLPADDAAALSCMRIPVLSSIDSFRAEGMAKLEVGVKDHMRQQMQQLHQSCSKGEADTAARNLSHTSAYSCGTEGQGAPAVGIDVRPAEVHGGSAALHPATVTNSVTVVVNMETAERPSHLPDDSGLNYSGLLSISVTDPTDIVLAGVLTNSVGHVADTAADGSCSYAAQPTYSGPEMLADTITNKDAKAVGGVRQQQLPLPTPPSLLQLEAGEERTPLLACSQEALSLLEASFVDGSSMLQQPQPPSNVAEIRADKKLSPKAASDGWSPSSGSTCAPSRCASSSDSLGLGPVGHFQSAEELMTFMQDPTRVVRLEWRRVRRTVSAGLTSHSMLDVQLQSGRRLRFEKFCDTGVLESVLVPGQGWTGSVYRGRTATANDLVRPLRAQELRQVAEALGSQPYSLVGANCHHFVRDVWNHLVIGPLRRYSHPDRIKGSIAIGISTQMGRLSLRRGGGSCLLQSRSLRSIGCKDVKAFQALGPESEEESAWGSCASSPPSRAAWTVGRLCTQLLARACLPKLGS